MSKQQEIEQLRAFAKNCEIDMHRAINNMNQSDKLASDIRRLIDGEVYVVEVGAALQAQAAAEPVWYAVMSEEAPIVNKAIRSKEVAQEYADKCSETYPGVKVVPLFATQAAPVSLQPAHDSITVDLLNDRVMRQQAALTEALSVLLDIRDGMGITGGGIDVAIAQIEALGVK